MAAEEHEQSVVEMTIYIYDWECFRYDWLVVFLDLADGTFTIFHNDAEALLNWMDPFSLYIGFNSKAYDQWIMKAACSGWENEDIKDLSDYLIRGGNGWEHPDADQMRFWFNNADIMDDMQQGLSLKAIEGHMGMSIEETEVDFNLDRPLTPKELEETIRYCKHDVEATAKLVQTRKNYLTTKISVGKMAGIPEMKALSMTNAKLTAAFLGARKPPVPWKDEREYRYPENLKREYIPREVFGFFDRMKDPSISDEVLFKSKLKVNIGEAEATIGYGGIHLGIPYYVWEGGDKCDTSGTDGMENAVST